MFKDLQIQILEDVAETCRPVADYEGRFSVYRIYTRDAIIERKRPEGLLELVEQWAHEDCTSTDVCQAMGMHTEAGVLTSIGMALSKLGWKRYKTRKVGGGALWRWRKS